MYLELQQYSNKLVKVFSGKNRLIFQFKHPRLYHKQASGIFDLNNFVGSSVTANTNQSNFINIAVSNSASVSMVPDKDVVEIHSLVFSNKTPFGKIYVLDSLGNPVKFNDYDKNLSSGRYLHEVVRFFGQFNHYTYQLVAAALLPIEIMQPDLVTDFIQTLSSSSSWYSKTHEIHGYSMSFCYPVLKEIKFYLYSESSYGAVNTESHGPSGIKGAYYYDAIKRSKTFSEFIKKYTGVNGSSFTKKVIELSKGTKDHYIGLSNSYIMSNIVSQETWDLLNETMAKTGQEEAARAVVGHQPHAIHRNVHMKFGDPLIDDINGGYMGGMASKMNTVPYKSEQFHHFGFFKFWNLFKDLVPLDFWFELEYVPKDIYDQDLMAKEMWDSITNLFKELPQPGQKKVFKSYSKHYLRDAANQYFTYKNSEDLPEKARELFPNGLQLPKKWKDTKELHDLISKDFNTIKQLGNWRRVKYDEFTSELNNIDFGDGWTSELPTDTVKITEYGRILKHCVASYADRCAVDNTTVILSINKNNNPIFTLELQQVVKDLENKQVRYIIRQFKGFQNKIPGADTVKFIIDKLYETKMISGVNEPSTSSIGRTDNPDLARLVDMAVGGLEFVNRQPERAGEVQYNGGVLQVHDGNGLVDYRNDMVIDNGVLINDVIAAGRVDFNPNHGYNQNQVNPLENIEVQRLQEALRAGGYADE